MSAKSSGTKSLAKGRRSPAEAPGERSEKPAAEKPALDVAIVCGVSEDGQSVDIIRRRGERLEAGTVRRLEEGKPIHGEVVRLRPRDQFPLICDVEVEMPAPGQPASGAAATGRPAQVATETYRKNWDAIYGRSKKSDPLLN